jgi:hypothetical protein
VSSLAQIEQQRFGHCLGGAKERSPSISATWGSGPDATNLVQRVAGIDPPILTALAVASLNHQINFPWSHCASSLAAHSTRFRGA